VPRASPPASPPPPCGGPLRWSKLQQNLYKKGQFDISKIPDIYDAIKYDLLHNHHLQLAGAQTLYVLAKALADDVIPSEYGITPMQKFRIGSCITHKLLVRITPQVPHATLRPRHA
jgi:inositol hexakisphosphate/diphosphoinositol-pentakisphosphate kinase